ncbi:acyltransferase [Gemmobacter sp.]|uniref:acyltransferase family protein n=1 Tax=Gemmobacter sp. TaxID=1898957 RepID=UPI002AFFD11C|nr:acyltransferase [Gemmobacter sp.]
MRILELDGLRAVAVLMVFFAHAGVFLPGGGVGVDVFFSISGYIITKILLDEMRSTGTISFGKFYKRQIRRLWPALFGLLLIFFIYGVVASLADGNLRAGILLSVAASAASFMNYARAFELGSGGLLGHTWSLAVEEQFYLIWPLLLLFCARISKRTSVTILLVSTILIALWRGWLGLSGSWWYAYHALETRADGLIFGALLAFVGAEHFRSLAKFWLLPSIYILAIAMTGNYWTSTPMLLGGHSLIAIASAWLVCACVIQNSPFTTVLASAPAVWLGDRSYSLYLWHYPILGVIGNYNLPAWLNLGAGFAGSLVAADLSYRLLENSFRKSRHPPAVTGF